MFDINNLYPIVIYNIVLIVIKHQTFQYFSPDRTTMSEQILFCKVYLDKYILY